ncbi:hypothetical protein B1A85_05640 [Chroococcidiopsis sp. TS-821]|nr:hypothetical protein B1A85_05640 [Chroococcidiopsis sp. TS-821]
MGAELKISLIQNARGLSTTQTLIEESKLKIYAFKTRLPTLLLVTLATVNSLLAPNNKEPPEQESERSVV